jgi:hypothetical protein
VKISVNFTPAQALTGIQEALEELDRINEFLVEYGIDYPTGYPAVKDMHSQLAGRLEEAEHEVRECNAQARNDAERIRLLEDAILGGALAISEHGGITDPNADALRMIAVQVEEERKKGSKKAAKH